ncbi:MAG: hypothetical protein FWD92_06220 [Methanomassiliicoccaceae archaeon]|nr:hypothetical protein [Methanomassiliicoccaceae archaeon]
MTIKLREELRNRAAWILSIYGAGGSGKTTLCYFLLDKWFPDERIAFFSYPQRVMDALPPHIRDRSVSFSRMRDIAGKRCIVVFDDTALHFLSRATSKKENKDIVQQMTISRHNDHRFIITAQNSILVDKGLFESLDQFSLRCKMTDFQSRTERPEFVSAQLAINEYLTCIIEDRSDLHPKGFWYCIETGELLHFPEWEHMSDVLSKPYRGCYVVDGCIEGF